nr:TetR/AcrR family transcriptional regulator [Gordonia jinghuaiqii]
MKSAVTLFEQNGYAATSVQSVVDAAGLTKGAFYHHFDNKEDLLRRVHDEFIHYQLGRARAVMAEKDQDLATALRRLIVEALIEPMSIYKSETAVFLQERRFLAGRFFEEIERKRSEFEGIFVDVIARGIDEGRFRASGPPKVVAFGIIGMGAWSHVWLDLDGPLSTREIGETFADMVIDGLGVDPP